MSTKKEEVKATSVEETKAQKDLVSENLVSDTVIENTESKTSEGLGIIPVDEPVEEKPALIFNFDELEKAEDLEELLKKAYSVMDDTTIIRKNTIGYVVGDKYLLSQEELVYFTEVIYKIK